MRKRGKEERLKRGDESRRGRFVKRKRRRGRGGRCDKEDKESEKERRGEEEKAREQK